MGFGDIRGHVRVSTRNPSGSAICDRCSFAYNHYRLSRQFQWGGAKLFDEGYLVCPRCLDKPQDQFRSLILPADPYPLINPRPDYYQTPPYPAVTPGNQGFSQYELTIVVSQAGGAQGIGQFPIGIGAIGVGYVSPGQQIYPTDKGQALASLQSVSGVHAPVDLKDRSTTIARANVTQMLVLANASRVYLAVYSPGGSQFAINTGTAVWGLTTNLMVGPGQAWLWATAQGFGVVYQGAVTVIGQQPGAPVWAWDG